MILYFETVEIAQIRKIWLDISTLIKYNFLMHYENVTKDVKYDIKKMQGI